MALANEITEKKYIKIEKGCINDPIYLEWHNKLGGKSYWLFGKLNTFQTKTAEVGYYERYVSDLESEQGNDGIINKSNERSISIGANIPADQMDGIRGLFESPKVKMLTNPETWSVDGAKWQDVRINTGSKLTGQTRKGFFEVEMDILLPKVYTISE